MEHSIVDHAASFRKIYNDIKILGREVRPRKLLILEIENYTYELQPFVRFQNFQSRKLNIQYIKDEFLWYVKGDKYDSSIANKAKMWQSIINSDGSINSNYGQYIFAGSKQFDNVVKILASDKDSRRASLVILGDDHLLSETKDMPCTYALNFRIRDNKLNMSVHMRSQDAIYGMGNDVPAFSFIHEMMLNALRRYYQTLEYGMYHHIADSFHVYEKHFLMLDKLCHNDKYVNIECPMMSGPDEVDFIRALDFSRIPKEFKFTRWLTSSE
jgi:thymidylate synthase